LASWMGAAIVFVQARRYFFWRKRNPNALKRAQKRLAQTALRDQNWEKFFPLALGLAKTAMELTQPASFAQEDPSLKEALRVLVQADRELRFSPEKTSSISAESLSQAWQTISRSL